MIEHARKCRDGALGHVVTDDDVRKHIQSLRQAAEIDLGLSDESNQDRYVARLLQTHRDTQSEKHTDRQAIKIITLCQTLQLSTASARSWFPCASRRKMAGWVFAICVRLACVNQSTFNPQLDAQF